MIKIIVPNSIWGGLYRNFRWGAIGVFAHTLQCGQRWIFLFRIKQFVFGYRTMGGAHGLLTSKDAGWWFPWQQKRTCSGRR